MELLARREHSRRELAAKLKRHHPDAALIERVLSGLEAERAQSDDRFVSEYVRQRSEKGYGPLRIQQELRQRGITAPNPCARRSRASTGPVARSACAIRNSAAPSRARRRSGPGRRGSWNIAVFRRIICGRHCKTRI